MPLGSIQPFRHLGLKALSVCVGVVLWMAVAGEETVERVLRTPLELQQVPSGVELRDELPATVDVRLRGASGLLRRLGPGDVVVSLDLRGARPGRRFVQLTSEHVHGPLGVDVMQINPSSLAIVLEMSASREVPIVPAIEGLPAHGFAIVKTTTEPATAEIVGPESVINRATEAVTEPISVAGAQATVSEIVTVGLRDTSLRLKNPRPVTVTVQIVRAPTERSSAQN